MIAVIVGAYSHIVHVHPHASHSISICSPENFHKALQKKKSMIEGVKAVIFEISKTCSTW